jgi:TonB family protein
MFSKVAGNGVLMDTVPVTSKDKVFTAVDQSPEFPGGITEFYQFLGRTIRYPAEMRRNNIQGRVIITFVVEKDGSLSNIVVLRSPGYGSAEESARVMALCPKWHPGMQNGKPVRVQYTVPISFTLAGTAPNKKKDTTQKTGMLKLSPVIKMDNLTLSSDTAKHRPIYILNGKEVNHDILTMLNPKDIESINVLKDKSAAAIYGQKGTYGVIVITTKNAPALLPANK